MPKYIDAEWLMKAVDGNLYVTDSVKAYVRCTVRKIPAADVEPVKHGHNVKWDYPTLFECSLCGWECFDTVPGDTDTYQYCPHCGAKMDGEADDGNMDI